MSPATIEEIRRGVQVYLADRSAAKMRASAILTHLQGEGHVITMEALTTELDFLHRAKWVDKDYPPGGTVPRYQATPELILARQRGEL